MKYQIGEIYMDEVTKQKTIFPNKTRKYLLPCLKAYGDTFTHKLNSVFKVAVGLGDMIVNKSGLKHEKHIFILLDSSIATVYFKRFLEWIKEQPMYEDDYAYGNLQKSTLHMVILKIPGKFYTSLDKFRGGAYSKMFEEKEIELFFNNHPDSKNVLIKKDNYKITFMGELNDWLRNKGKDRIPPEEWQGEFDLPPFTETEVFNNHLK